MSNSSKVRTSESGEQSMIGNGQQAFRQAVELPLEQTLQFQQNMAKLMMNGLEAQNWAQSRGIKLTKDMVNSYLQSFNEVIETTEQMSETGMEAARTQGQAMQQPFQQTAAQSEQYGGGFQQMGQMPQQTQQPAPQQFQQQPATQQMQPQGISQPQPQQQVGTQPQQQIGTQPQQQIGTQPQMATQEPEQQMKPVQGLSVEPYSPTQQEAQPVRQGRTRQQRQEQGREAGQQSQPTETSTRQQNQSTRPELTQE